MDGQAPPDPDFAARVSAFAGSELFERTFAEGMRLVEETVAYLDGPGRAASKRLPRTVALAYAGESMRLTTRLMQVASWLMVQRALRDGEMSVDEASEGRYRFANRDPAAPAFVGAEDLPGDLRGLMNQAGALYERVRRLDIDMYAAAPKPVDQVQDQLRRLREAFGD
jgi:regulator of CtrA degradation